MPTFSVLKAAAIAALVLAAGALPVRAADVAALREGTNDGADFQISVPANWNGGLVMFARSYKGEGPARGNFMVGQVDGRLGLLDRPRATIADLWDHSG